MAAVTIRNLGSRFILHSKGADAFSCNVIWRIQAANYAAPKRTGAAAKPALVKGKMMAPVQKRELVVETDAHLLCSRLCGGNIYKEGEDPVLKPDSEYPDWLWSLYINKTPIPLEELDQNEWQYWKRLKKINLRQNNLERKHKKLEKMVVNKKF